MMARGIIDELMPSFKSGIGRYDDQVYDIRSVFLARFCLISLYDIHHFAPPTPTSEASLEHALDIPESLQGYRTVLPH